MALQNVIALGIDDVAHCVKVDDAAPGISEGLHAGMWSVGLAVSGNEFGATWEAYQAMSKEEIATRRERAAGKLYAAGAHYVVDTWRTCRGDCGYQRPAGKRRAALSG